VERNEKHFQKWKAFSPAHFQRAGAFVRAFQWSVALGNIGISPTSSEIVPLPPDHKRRTKNHEQPILIFLTFVTALSTRRPEDLVRAASCVGGEPPRQAKPIELTEQAGGVPRRQDLNASRNPRSRFQHSWPLANEEA
jgi:hypothetical protein